MHGNPDPTADVWAHTAPIEDDKGRCAYCGEYFDGDTERTTPGCEKCRTCEACGCLDEDWHAVECTADRFAGVKVKDGKFHCTGCNRYLVEVEPNTWVHPGDELNG